MERDWKWITEAILAILPHLDHDSAENAAEKLYNDGVDSADLLCEIRVDDFKDIIPPIKARKLVSVWKQGSSLGDTISDAEKNKPSLASSRYASQWCFHYEIPWNKFSKEFTALCDKGEKPNNRIMNQTIVALMDDIRSECKKPTRKELRKVATKVIEKYPHLATEIGGVVIGDGTSTLLAKLESRRDNLLRPETHKLKSTDTSTAEPPDATKTKKRKKDTYGCIEEMVSPDIPEGETPESQDEKASLLRDHFELMQFDRDYVTKLMNETYASQRALMNANNPPIRVKEILNKYPFLCEEEWLLRHFTMLTGVNLAAMKNDLSEKAVRIYRYFKAQKNPSGQLRTELASIAEAVAVEKSNKPVVDHLIPLLAAHFKEEGRDVLRTYKDPTSPAEVEQLADIPTTPFVAMSGNRIYILAEKNVMTLSIRTIQSAILYTLAVYFVFGIEYPQHTSCTMDFVQRYVCRVNPPSGSKVKQGKRSGYHVSQKVVNFAEDMARYESDWIEEEE